MFNNLISKVPAEEYVYALSKLKFSFRANETVIDRNMTNAFIESDPGVI